MNLNIEGSNHFLSLFHSVHMKNSLLEICLGPLWTELAKVPATCHALGAHHSRKGLFQGAGAVLQSGQQQAGRKQRKPVVVVKGLDV